MADKFLPLRPVVVCPACPPSPIFFLQAQEIGVGVHTQANVPPTHIMRWLTSTMHMQFLLGFLVLAPRRLVSVAYSADVAGPQADIQVNQKPLEPLCDDGADSGSEHSTFSVIVVADHDRVSTLFDDPARVCAFTEGLVYVQMAPLKVDNVFDRSAGWAPFYAAHPAGVDRRLTVVDLLNNNLDKELRLTREQVINSRAVSAVDSSSLAEAVSIVSCSRWLCEYTERELSSLVVTPSLEVLYCMGSVCFLF